MSASFETKGPRTSGQPLPIERRVYDEVEEAAVRSLSRCAAVRGIFRMGSIGEPGISDLDLIVLAAGKRAPVDIPDVRKAHPSAPYVMMHAPFLVDEAIFPNIRYLAGVSNLERIAGDAPMPRSEEIPAVVRLHLAAKYALDGLFFACRQRCTGVLEIRSTLCALNTMAHLLELAQTEIHVPTAAATLAEDVQQVRRSWFTEPSVDRLWTLVSEAVPAYLGVLDAVGEAAPGSSPPGTLALSWLNMDAVVADKESATVCVKASWAGRLADRSPGENRHIDDLRWLMRDCLVEMTPRAGWLVSCGAESQCPTDIRHRIELLDCYTRWLGNATESFAMLCPRVDAPEPSGLKWRALSVARRLA